MSPAISNARNSSSVFRKPLAHLLIRPRPHKRMGVAAVGRKPDIHPFEVVPEKADTLRWPSGTPRWFAGGNGIGYGVFFSRLLTPAPFLVFLSITDLVHTIDGRHPPISVMA